jgi:hypothetical protein
MKYILIAALAIVAVEAHAANIYTCPNAALNGKGPIASHPCATVPTPLPANAALVARASDAKGTNNYWSAYGGVPANAYLSTDAGWVLKSAAATTATPVTPPVTPVTPVGQAQLTWSVVTLNTDNSAVAGPINYKIFAGTATPLEVKATVSTPSYLVTGLTPGTWLFAVSAVDKDGNESAQSATVSKVVTGVAPPTAPAGLEYK